MVMMFVVPVVSVGVVSSGLGSRTLREKKHYGKQDKERR
jgi:hypothetical protein